MLRCVPVLILLGCSLLRVHSAEILLVNPTDAWLLHKGLTAPQPDWKTAPAADLTNWVSVPGGVGFSSDSSSETAECRTILNDMRGNYKTVYLRRTFQAPEDLSPDLHLFLKVDFDDGFIAWLDGQYLTNRNSPGAPTEPAHTNSATSNHESSKGNSSAQPAMLFDLGSATTHLPPGEHTLALLGLNSSSSSSDFILIPTLYLAAPPTNGLNGLVTSDLTLTASNSPHFISGDLTVADNVTLRIEPGVTLLLDSGVTLTVSPTGRLLAEGTADDPILFTRVSTNGPSWGKIVIRGGPDSPENRIVHAYLEGNGSSPCIEVDRGTVHLGHLSFGTTSRRYLDLDDSSFVVTDCHFPATTASFEPVHGTGGIKPGGHGIIQNCYFGKINGYSDTIDFTGGNRPGPIVQFINNVFMGTGDDNLDLDSADAWVQGNIFLHVHKNGSPDTSSGVSGGSDDGQHGNVTMLGNIFFDCDQAVMAKQGNFYTLLNNTIVKQTHEGGLDTEGAVLCTQDNNMTEGRGMYLEGNIMVDIEQLTRDVTNAVVTFTNNFLPLPWPGPGGGNSTLDPQLTYIPPLEETWFTNWTHAQIMKEWLKPRPNSPAGSAGPNSIDSGASIPFGVSLFGVPEPITAVTHALIHVGPNRTGSSIPVSDWPHGSGYTHYRWRLDNADWSEETSIAEPITLTNLDEGTHTIEVVGKNDAGFYQDNPLFGSNALVTKRVWTVQTAPRFSSIQALANEVELRFFVSAGAAYEVEFSDLLSPQTPWQTLTNLPIQPTTGEVFVRDQPDGSTARFYRLRRR